MKKWEQFLPFYNLAAHLAESQAQRAQSIDGSKAQLSRNKILAYTAYSIAFMFLEYKTIEVADNLMRNFNSQTIEQKVNIHKDSGHYIIHEKYEVAKRADEE